MKNCSNSRTPYLFSYSLHSLSFLEERRWRAALDRFKCAWFKKNNYITEYSTSKWNLLFQNTQVWLEFIRTNFSCSFSLQFIVLVQKKNLIHLKGMGSCNNGCISRPPARDGNILSDLCHWSSSLLFLWLPLFSPIFFWLKSIQAVIPQFTPCTNWCPLPYKGSITSHCYLSLALWKHIVCGTL